MRQAEARNEDNDASKELDGAWRCDSELLDDGGRRETALDVQAALREVLSSALVGPSRRFS